MNEVPTTRVPTDLLAKKKEIEEKIVLLKSQSEVELKGLDGVRDFVRSLQAQASSLEALIADLCSDSRTSSDLAKSLVLEAIDVCKMANQMAEEYLKMLSKLDDMVKTEIQNIAIAKKNQLAINDEIANEKKTLRTMKLDLDIYKDRLAAHYKEHLPGVKLIL